MRKCYVYFIFATDASTVEDILGRSVGSCTEAHINTEDASDSTPVTVEQSILDDYLIGMIYHLHSLNRRYSWYEV